MVYSAFCTFQQLPVNVLILRFGQCRVFVEQICHKRQVEFGVTADNIGRGDKLSTAKPVGLLQHGLRPLQIVFLLFNAHRPRASIRDAGQLLPRGEETQLREV